MGYRDCAGFCREDDVHMLRAATAAASLAMGRIKFAHLIAQRPV
jgi:hypothetical protein